jgi:hypothetical protein
MYDIRERVFQFTAKPIPFPTIIRVINLAHNNRETL